MNSEQRALATLDLTLKNAFETLNKFSVWARTPDSEVTFNLVDALPTIDSAGTGIFLKPITVPSFASVRSSIFGTPNTKANRSLYWNLDFSAVYGWKFSSYNPATPAKLEIEVDTYIGSNNTAVTVQNTNSTSKLTNSKIELDVNSGIYGRSDKDAKILSIDSSELVARLNTIELGRREASSSIFGREILLSNGDPTRDVLRYSYIPQAANTQEINKITIGPSDDSLLATYSTLLKSGELGVQLVAGNDFSIIFDSTKNIQGGDLFKAKYNTPGYDLYLGYNFGNINSLTIGDVSNFSLSAKKSLKIFGDYGSIVGNDSGLSLIGLNNLSLSSQNKTSIGSKTSLNLGIEDENGDISNEIVVTKGVVSIPNLYVQKKANYILSGIKHISEYDISPSVIYLPDSVAETISSDSYAYEYSKNLTNVVIEDEGESDFDTTINDLSGAIKSYLVRRVSNGIELMSADATYVGTTSVITTPYATVANVVGLSAVVPSTSNACLKTLSTPNGMYIFVKERENFAFSVGFGGATAFSYKYNVYFSSDCLNFSKLASFDIPYDTVYNISFDYVNNDTIDYIWFTHTHKLTGKRYLCNKNTDYTYILYYLENSCGNGNIVNTNIFNVEGSQIVAGVNPGDSRGKFGRVDQVAIAKVIAVEDFSSPYGSYALILGTFGCQWRTVSYKKKKANSTLSSIGGLIPGKTTVTIDSKTNYAHATFMLKYVSKGNYIEESTLFGFMNDSGNANDLSDNISIADFEWDPTGTPNGRALITNALMAKVISFGLTGQTGVTGASTLVSLTSISSSVILGSIASLKIISKLFVDRLRNGSVAEDYSMDYVLATQPYDWSIGKIISSKGFIYYNDVQGSLKYYDVDGVDEHAIEVVVSKVYPNGDYDINGAVVDYIGANYNEFGDFCTKFVLTSDPNGDFRLNTNESPTDRRIYVETEDSDITSIIHSSDSLFTPNKISSVLSVDYDKTSSIEISLSNVYNPRKADNAPDLVISEASLSAGALNFHIEPVAYLVKNRFMNISSLVLGGYTITKIQNNLYSLLSENNKLSGYRIPYHTEYDLGFGEVSPDQLVYSNKSTGAPNETDMNSSLSTLYVTVENEYTSIHDNQSILLSKAVITIPNRLVDPTNATFDPSCAIVNEFSNVVALKLPYVFGFRSKNCGANFPRGKANLILGLTEIAQIGGGC